MFLRLAVPAVAFGLVACGAEKPAPAVPEQAAPPPAAPVAGPLPQAMVRGIVRLTPTLSFRSCEGQSLMTLVDNSGGRLISNYRLMQADESDGMYVLGRAATSPSNELLLGEIEYAGLPGGTEGCQQPLPDYVISARGEDPAWRLTIGNGGIVFVREADQTSMNFPAVTPDDSAGRVRYQSTTGGDQSFHLLLDRNGCAGRRAGMYASMTADLIIGGQTLRGCAWRGRLP